MKKLLLTIVAAMFFGSAVAGDDRPVDYNQFPKAAKEFILKHFSKATITSSTLDDDGQYTAYLSSGAKVEFRANGVWKEVDCGTNAVPATIINSKIASYVKKSYASSRITKIDVDATNYEVKLNNGVELEFDLGGNFLRIDR